MRQERIEGRGPRQYVAGSIGSPSSTRISLGRVQNPKESTSTIYFKLDFQQAEKLQIWSKNKQKATKFRKQ